MSKKCINCGSMFGHKHDTPWACCPDCRGESINDIKKEVNSISSSTRGYEFSSSFLKEIDKMEKKLKEESL